MSDKHQLYQLKPFASSATNTAWDLVFTYLWCKSLGNMGNSIYTTSFSCSLCFVVSVVLCRWKFLQEFWLRIQNHNVLFNQASVILNICSPLYEASFVIWHVWWRFNITPRALYNGFCILWARYVEIQNHVVYAVLKYLIFLNICTWM